MPFKVDSIAEGCIRVLLQVQKEVLELVWHDPGRCFEPVYLQGQQKPAAVVDIAAEWKAVAGLRRLLSKLNPLILGEESLRLGANMIESHRGIVVLLDAIDGTRLLECGWGDWCSAATVIDAAERQILCAIVVLPSGISYFATPEGAVRLRRRGAELERQVLRLSHDELPRPRTGIAFYGYRQPRFKDVGTEAIAMQLEDGSRPDVFVVGGNPALVHLIEASRGIDAVIEPIGQSLHDFLPGAYICHQAGGTVTGLTRDLDLDHLIFTDPLQKIPFLATRSAATAKRLQNSLRAHSPEFAGAA